MIYVLKILGLIFTILCILYAGYSIGCLLYKKRKRDNKPSMFDLYIKDAEDLQLLLTGDRVNRVINIEVIRGGTVQTVQVTIGQRS